MQAPQRSFLANCFYPSPFGVVPQLNMLSFQISLKDLSVALLYSQILLPLFSFQGAITSPQSPLAPFPPFGENCAHFFAPPFQIEPASLGFDLIKRNDALTI